MARNSLTDAPAEGDRIVAPSGTEFDVVEVADGMVTVDTTTELRNLQRYALGEILAAEGWRA